MPNYDYQCHSCGKRFEVFQSMNDPKLLTCPDTVCSGPVKRLLGTGAGLIFKGSGFYKTDNPSSSYQAGAKAESSSQSASTPAKSDSAPATPAPAAPAAKPAAD